MQQVGHPAHIVAGDVLDLIGGARGGGGVMRRAELGGGRGQPRDDPLPDQAGDHGALPVSE